MQQLFHLPIGNMYGQDSKEG